MHPFVRIHCTLRTGGRAGTRRGRGRCGALGAVGAVDIAAGRGAISERSDGILAIFFPAPAPQADQLELAAERLVVVGNALEQHSRETVSGNLEGERGGSRGGSGHGGGESLQAVCTQRESAYSWS